MTVLAGNKPNSCQLMFPWCSLSAYNNVMITDGETDSLEKLVSDIRKLN